MCVLWEGEKGFVFDTQTEIQKTFIAKIRAEGIDAALAWLKTVKDGKERTHPRALTLCREPTGRTDVLEVAEDTTFDRARVYTAREGRVTLENLKIDTEYFFRVNGGETNRFRTEGAFARFIRIDGALNVRDIGGGRIKQGLIYRGSDICDHFPLTEKGKRTFTEELGIRTEIDLRAEATGDLTVSAAGACVRRVHLPYRPYREVFEPAHRKGICRIMEFLSDEEVYPVYVHCFGGADRTGMIALYLRALAGESDDTIHTDYELTGLSTYGAGAKEGADGFRRRNADYYLAFLSMLEKYAPKAPLSVTVPLFLQDAGVTPDCLARIRRIIQKAPSGQEDA